MSSVFNLTNAQCDVLAAMGDEAACADCDGMGFGPMECINGDTFEPKCRLCEGSGLSMKAREALVLGACAALRGDEKAARVEAHFVEPDGSVINSALGSGDGGGAP